MHGKMILLFLCAALLALTGSAFADAKAEDGSLYDLWLSHREALEEDCEECRTDGIVDVGGRIDGHDIAAFTLENLGEHPLNAEGLFLSFEPYYGEWGLHLDTAIVQKVNYRYGESEVILTDSVLFKTEMSYGGSDESCTTEYGLYRFTIRTGSYSGDLLVVDMNPVDDGYSDTYAICLRENDDSYKAERAYNAGRGDIGVMQVVNCEEWVSLRAEASANSDRITQIPVGDCVLAYENEDGFIRCNYNGLMGYVQAQYLEQNENCIYEQNFYFGSQNG